MARSEALVERARRALGILSGGAEGLHDSPVDVLMRLLFVAHAQDRGLWPPRREGLSDRGVSALSTPAIDGATVQRALEALRTANGRPVDHGALDVEQIGRVYEALLRAGPGRRRTSSHYTPRILVAPLVRRALSPLLAAAGEAPSSAHLLSLRVCDPAMGCGAFLLEACRFLSGALAAAWEREGALPAVAAAHGDVAAHARRAIAERCLFGVDTDARAVELARLSLWLLVGDRDLPLSFADHGLCHGDALVGLDAEQIRSFHWERGRPPVLPGERLGGRDRARLVGDVVVGAFFEGKTGRERERERRRRLGLVTRWLESGGSPGEELLAMQRRIRRRIPVFHWGVELPGAACAGQERPPGMSAVIGNPPFLGGRRVRGELGDEYTEWLGASEGGSLNADLSARFFRLGARLLGEDGTLGLVATSTIGEGDSRETGLLSLVRDGFTVYDATRPAPWPGEAVVSVATVCLARGAPAARCDPPRLDGRTVARVSSRLLPDEERSGAARLRSSAAFSFQGCVLAPSRGFVLTRAERDRLVARDARNAERILRFLGGEEVNSPPSPGLERYAIFFGGMSLEEAGAWPDLLDVVRQRARPVRERAAREAHRRRWWQYADRRPGMFEALSGLTRCLVCARVSKHLLFSFQPAGRVFSEQLYVIALDTDTAFAVLQSRVHEAWARHHASSLGPALRYVASKCFETFPFPERDPRAVVASLEDAGQRLYEARARYLSERGVGLTGMANRLKDAARADPEIVRLRRLHEAMDRAVLDAYGWGDVEVPPYGVRADAGREVYSSFEREVMDRLFVLNALRAEEEG